MNREKMKGLAQYKDTNNDEGVYADIHKQLNRRSTPHANRMRNLLPVIPRSEKRTKERGY